MLSKIRLILGLIGVAVFAMFLALCFIPKAHATYYVPRAQQQPQHGTYMYCKQKKVVSSDGGTAYVTMCRGTDGRWYVQ